MLYLELLIGCFVCFFEGVVSLEFNVVVDNKTIDLLDFLIPTVFSKNERCRNDSLLYRQELSKFTVWAADMFDASSKFPSGIFIGSIYDTGNFDECVKVKLPKEIGFSGQHCMANFKLKPLEKVPVDKLYSLKYDKFDYIFNISTWQKIAAYTLDDSKYSRDESYFSFCLPSSCSYNDLEEELKRKIGDIKNGLPFSLDIHVDPRHCQVLKEFDYSSGNLIFMGVTATLILVGISSTLYDINSRLGHIRKFSGKTHEVVRCFSFSNTCKKLNSFKKIETNFECIDGMKVLTMFLIILGHRLMFYTTSPLSDPSFLEGLFRFFPLTILSNGPIIVDTFFLISGILGCYFLMLEFDKRQKMIPLGLFYLHRLMRLTPTYAFVIAFYCTIFIQLGEGPFWEEKIGAEQHRCLESWWANILYINNYVNLDNICMFQSWFLTCEIHYFLFLPILIYIIWKKPMLGMLLMIFLIIISLIVPFIIILINKEDPILLLYAKNLRNVVDYHTFQIVYIPSHMRACSFLVGIVTGYLLYKMQKSGYKLSNTVTRLGWIGVVIIVFAIYIMAFTFYFPDVEKNYLYAAAYGSLHHLLWSGILSWGIVAVFVGSGSWIKPISTWKPFGFLSRITYTTYLCHGAVQIYSAGIARGPVNTGFFTVLTLSASDITISYIIGFLLTLLIEGPLISLEKIIFQHAVSTNDDPKRTTSEEHSHNEETINERKKSEFKGIPDIYIPRTHLYDTSSKSNLFINENK